MRHLVAPLPCCLATPCLHHPATPATMTEVQHPCRHRLPQQTPPRPYRLAATRPRHQRHPTTLRLCHPATPRRHRHQPPATTAEEPPVPLATTAEEQRRCNHRLPRQTTSCLCHPTAMPPHRQCHPVEAARPRHQRHPTTLHLYRPATPRQHRHQPRVTPATAAKEQHPCQHRLPRQTPSCLCCSTTVHPHHQCDLADLHLCRPATPRRRHHRPPAFPTAHVSMSTYRVEPRLLTARSLLLTLMELTILPWATLSPTTTLEPQRLQP